MNTTTARRAINVTASEDVTYQVIVYRCLENGDWSPVECDYAADLATAKRSATILLSLNPNGYYAFAINRYRGCSLQDVQNGYAAREAVWQSDGVWTGHTIKWGAMRRDRF